MENATDDATRIIVSRIIWDKFDQKSFDCFQTPKHTNLFTQKWMFQRALFGSTNYEHTLFRRYHRDRCKARGNPVSFIINTLCNLHLKISFFKRADMKRATIIY
mmetsp:Transcript_15969/g.32998  ORF Transcript_15969/g.32998 Transcript_15969/m.32998 type:complete len:104 (-) Transcript_15969:444-755(-)